MTRKLDIHKIAALSQCIIEHEAAILKCTAEIHALLGVAPAEGAAPVKRGRRPKAPASDVVTFTPAAAPESKLIAVVASERDPGDNPHHGHASEEAGHDLDRVDPREDPGPMPSFLVRGAAAPEPKP